MPGAGAIPVVSTLFKEVPQSLKRLARLDFCQSELSLAFAVGGIIWLRGICTRHFFTPKEGIMARPIEATPVLKGKDAVAFIKAVENPKPFTPPVIDMDRLNKRVEKYLADRGKK